MNKPSLNLMTVLVHIQCENNMILSKLPWSDWKVIDMKIGQTIYLVQFRFYIDKILKLKLIIKMIFYNLRSNLINLFDFQFSCLVFK